MKSYTAPSIIKIDLNTNSFIEMRAFCNGGAWSPGSSSCD